MRRKAFLQSAIGLVGTSFLGCGDDAAGTDGTAQGSTTGTGPSGSTSTGQGGTGGGPPMGAAFTAAPGWSQISGSFAPGASMTIGQGAADLGTGPNVVLFADFSAGAEGALVPAPQLVGAFSELTDTGGGGTQHPYFTTGPDGRTWMNMMSAALGANSTWAQANLAGLADFDTFYVSHQIYGDFTDGDQTYTNQKDIWVTRDGEVSGAGHDTYTSALRGEFSNVSGPIYTGGNSTSDNPGNEPPHGGYWRRNVQTFREVGVRPHTVAAPNALVDCFIQGANAGERYQDTSTGLVERWSSPGVPPAWNQIYFLGMYQDQQADHMGEPPHLTYYLIQDLYIATGANAWKRFLVTDASTLEASRSIFCALPLSWSAGEVTLRIPSGISDYTGKYLWYADGVTYVLVGTT